MLNWVEVGEMLVKLFIHKSAASGLEYLQFFENVKIGEKFCPKLILTYFSLSLSEIITFTFLLVSFIIIFFFFFYFCFPSSFARKRDFLSWISSYEKKTKKKKKWKTFTAKTTTLNKLKNTCYCCMSSITNLHCYMIMSIFELSDMVSFILSLVLRLDCKSQPSSKSTLLCVE